MLSYNILDVVQVESWSAYIFWFEMKDLVSKAIDKFW